MIYIIYLAIFIVSVTATHYYVNKNREHNKLVIRYNYIVAVILIACMYFFHNHYSKEHGDQIGSWFEKGEYDASYYVNLFEKETESKNYRVEAHIYRYEGEYSLFSITWPNGGYITFENQGYDYPLKPFNKVEIKDDDGKTWYVELTKEKIRSIAPN